MTRWRSQLFPGLLNETLERISQAERHGELTESIERFRVRVVLTAHPTQFYPSRVLGIITDLSRALSDNDVPRIYDYLLQLGKTRFSNREKPTPMDEARSLLWYLEHVFYETAPSVHGPIAMAAGRTLKEAMRLNAVVELAFWPGGDRDGNPFVDAQTTVDVALMLRRSIMNRYLEDIRNLTRRLTFDGAIERLATIEARLVGTLSIACDIDAASAYTTAEDLEQDLTELWEHLQEKHDGLFAADLERLIWRVRVFGFHFATVDLRQDSRVHRRTVDRLIQSQEKPSPDKRWARTVQALRSQRFPSAGEIASRLSDDTVLADTVASLRSAREVQALSGPRGMHRYIISNTQSAADILEVLYLCRCAGYPADEIALDILPLFETANDLENAETILEQLYRSPVYRRHLSSRGGGKTHQFYRGMDRETAGEEIHLTIQGQTISANFGTPETARHNLEQLVTAGLETRLLSEDYQPLSHQERELLDRLSTLSLDRYRDLKQHPQFLSYLEEMTPLKMYGEANNASRPTSRVSTERLRLEDLRAIPFVGAWSQMKQNVPGYFGFGSALGALIEEGEIQALRRLFRKHLFFRTLVENSMQSISKANFNVTRYLAEDPRYGELWSTLEEELVRTRETLLTIADSGSLLSSDSGTKQSITLRERIVLPVLTIQQYALSRLREEGTDATDATDISALRKLVVRSMAAIINAGRNAV